MNSQQNPADLRPNQNWGAIVAIGAAATCLLCGYEFVRSVSSSLFIGAYGAARLPVVMTLGPVCTAALVYGYGLLLTRFGARRALFISSAVAAGVVAACYVGLMRHVSAAAAVLYVFREAYIVVLVAQYWSFINSTVPFAQARLVNGPITGFGSIGAITGATVVHLYAKQFGSEAMLLFAVASFIPAGLLANLAYRLGGEPAPREQDGDGRQGAAALGLFLRTPYLMLLACLIMITQAVSTALDLRFSGIVETTFGDQNARTAYLGGFYATLNGVAFALQFGVAPLAMRFLPLRVIHACIPVVHLATCTLLLLRPSIRTGATAFLLFKSIDYSLFGAAKETLYIPLTYDARYRAKSVIDAFGYRFSKGAIGGILALAGLIAGKLPAMVYPVIALVSAGVWLPLVLRLTGKASSSVAGAPVAVPSDGAA